MGTKVNVKLADGQWASVGVSNGSLWAKYQKGERKFLTEQELIANATQIKEALAARKNRSQTSESAIAKELGALALEVLGEETEG